MPFRTQASSIRIWFPRTHPSHPPDLSAATLSEMPKKGKLSYTHHRPGLKSGSTTRPTHFLCFPIASEQTVPVIAKALKHWTDTTVRPAPLAPARWPRGTSTTIATTTTTTKGDQEPAVGTRGSEEDAIDGGSSTTPDVERPTLGTFAESLKLLPPAVTRAAGSWHLTLGVMDLHEEAQMEKALEILHGLDLRMLLDEAARGPPARKWGGGPETRTRTRDAKGGSGWEEGNALTETVDASTEAKHSSGTREVQQEAEYENSDAEGSAEKRDTTPPPPPPTPPPLIISLTGLGGFPSLQNARVLWARPREQPALPVSPSPSSPRPNRLYNFSLHVLQPFRDAGLITETRPLALHATIANMRFAKRSGPSARGVGKDRAAATAAGGEGDRVDATQLGRVWNDFGGDVNAAADRDRNRDQDQGRTADGAVTAAAAAAEAGVHDHDASWGDHHARGHVWLRDFEINRVAICRLGAAKHGDPVWGQWYPAIEDGERLIF